LILQQEIYFSVFSLEIQSFSSHLNKWREEQLSHVSELIQQKIQSIQTPPEKKCEDANKIICGFSGMGFGAQIHSLMTCLLKGFYTQKLVVIDGIFDNYLSQTSSKWDEFISPISETCQPNYHSKFEPKDTNSLIFVDRKLILMKIKSLLLVIKYLFVIF
jgi:hypothetical protein